MVESLFCFFQITIILIKRLLLFRSSLSVAVSFIVFLGCVCCCSSALFFKFLFFLNFFILNILILKIKKYYFYLLKWLHRVKETADKVGREMVKDEIMAKETILWKVSRFKDSTSLWQESSEGRTFYCWNPGRDRWFHDGFLSGCNGGAFCQDTEMWDLQCWFWMPRGYMEREVVER